MAAPSPESAPNTSEPVVNPAAPAQTAPAPPQANPTTAQSGDGQGDALDKGIKSLAGKLGFGAKVSNSNVEKASDGVRSLFKKFTGKDVPIKDQEMK